VDPALAKENFIFHTQRTQFSWLCVKVFAIPVELSASKLAHKKEESN